MLNAMQQKLYFDLIDAIVNKHSTAWYQFFTEKAYDYFDENGITESVAGITANFINDNCANKQKVINEAQAKGVLNAYMLLWLQENQRYVIDGELANHQEFLLDAINDLCKLAKDKITYSNKSDTDNNPQQTSINQATKNSNTIYYVLGGLGLIGLIFGKKK